ncbi:MAG TPA: hypothetical protein VFI54_21525, partial [Solirubrobacteraceae bacterium]|nr:hypothetical protein [Solirubrobacteraceae bacterium]
ERATRDLPGNGCDRALAVPTGLNQRWWSTGSHIAPALKRRLGLPLPHPKGPRRRRDRLRVKE